jgi:ferric-dicitrate binding protein FerR (iron transport regulator)
MVKKILQRYIEGDITPEEKIKLVKWLEGNEKGMLLYYRLRKLYDISIWCVAGKNQAVSHRDKRHFSKWSLELLKIAAIFIVTVIGVYAFMYQKKSAPKMHTLYVPPGQRTEIILSDGTKVYLNSGSKLRFPEYFSDDNRAVELNGEGFFEVTNNPSRPFVIKAQQYDVRVLGTEFNVIAYDSHELFEVSLLKGAIDIGSPLMKNRISIEPAYKFRKQGGESVISIIDNYNYFRWKEGLICFENEPLASLIAKLELYYDVKIEVRAPFLSTHIYTGKFRIRDGVEHVLRVLQLELKFKYTIYEEENRIVLE